MLKTTLTVGVLADVAQASDAAQRASADSPLGEAVDNAWRWLKEPMPDWLKVPVAQLLEPVGRTLTSARQQVEREIVQRIKTATLTAEQVTQSVKLAGDVMKETYLVLLGLSWATQRPNAALMRAGSQSTPQSAAMLRADQPRQPWQDVHMRLEGPAVYDLAMNFIRRWNSLQRSYLVSQRARGFAVIPDRLIPAEPAYTDKGPGTAHVRVLRSASFKLQQQERAAMPQLPKPISEQHDIHDMMVRVILGAVHFVYIESQFFQSRFGVPSIDPATVTGQRAQSTPLKHLLSQSGERIRAAVTLAGNNKEGNKLPENQIAWALGQRIEHAVRWGMPFHAYIVLPVHPEGPLNDLAILGQIHWTMQSLVYGSHSLVNRVRCAIAAKRLLSQLKVINKDKWQAALLAVRGGEPGHRPYEKITPAEWAPYLTLLNLRNCEKVGGQLRTEQIYVHSKLLIADDCEVIIGSANINDRSLNGDRDSELALFVQDRAIVKSMTHGYQSNVCVFGHKLRTDLWRKHLALTGGGNEVVKPASALAGMMEQPAARQTIKLIQQIATSNQAAYERTFEHVPRDLGPGGEVAASIWPMVNRDPKQTEQTWRDIQNYSKQMPFSEAFWRAGEKSVQLPQVIQGFFTALPIDWTSGENNHPDMNKSLLTFNNDLDSGERVANARADQAEKST